MLNYSKNKRGYRNKNHIVNFIAGGVFAIFGAKRLRQPKTDDLKHAEFKTSTQRLGVRFSERIRDIFRIKWTRKKGN